MTDLPLDRALFKPSLPRSGRDSLQATLLGIATTAASGLAADFAAITVLDDRDDGVTLVFTDETAPEIDQAQYDADRGPCLDSLRGVRVLRVDDATQDGRWPEFAATAVSHGIHSSLSLPLVVEGLGIGALNLYARPKHNFDGVTEDFGMAFAAQAAAAVLHGIAYWEKATLAEQLETAMASRAVIEQAKGVLMATTGCSADEAFNLLREQSQMQNVKLRDIAAELVERQQRGR